MSNRIFTEHLFPQKDEDEIVELVIEKRRRMYLHITLIFIYAALLITSLFIV